MNSRRTEAQRQPRSNATTQAASKRRSPTKTGVMDTVSIDIRGKRLSIRTDHDPAFVKQLSHYVDDKLRDLQSMAPSAPFEKLLMLASLTLAEELFEARGELGDLRADLATRTEAMMALIEEEAARLGD